MQNAERLNFSWYRFAMQLCNEGRFAACQTQDSKDREHKENQSRRGEKNLLYLFCI